IENFNKALLEIRRSSVNVEHKLPEKQKEIPKKSEANTVKEPKSDWLAISDYDVIFTALDGEYKAEHNRGRELGVLPKFHSKAVLKIHEYPSADDFERKKRLHGV
ncbi:unnamed protein product, partial [Porites evermanni]